MTKEELTKIVDYANNQLRASLDGPVNSFVEVIQSNYFSKRELIRNCNLNIE